MKVRNRNWDLRAVAALAGLVLSGSACESGIPEGVLFPEDLEQVETVCQAFGTFDGLGLGSTSVIPDASNPNRIVALSSDDEDYSISVDLDEETFQNPSGNNPDPMDPDTWTIADFDATLTLNQAPPSDGNYVLLLAFTSIRDGFIPPNDPDDPTQFDRLDAGYAVQSLSGPDLDTDFFDGFIIMRDRADDEDPSDQTLGGVFSDADDASGKIPEFFVAVPLTSTPGTKTFRYQVQVRDSIMEIAQQFQRAMFLRVPDPNDLDADGIANDSDNCPLAFNPAQQDGDGDEAGDACDGEVLAFHSAVSECSIFNANDAFAKSFGPLQPLGRWGQSPLVPVHPGPIGSFSASSNSSVIDMREDPAGVAISIDGVGSVVAFPERVNEVRRVDIYPPDDIKQPLIARPSTIGLSAEDITGRPIRSDAQPEDAMCNEGGFEACLVPGDYGNRGNGAAWDALCRMTRGFLPEFSPSGDEWACVLDFYNSQAFLGPLLGQAPLFDDCIDLEGEECLTVARAVSIILSGNDEAGDMIEALTEDVPNAVAGVDGSVVPLVELNFDDPNADDEFPFVPGGTPDALDSSLTEEQEGHLGCGNWYGSDCDVAGLRTGPGGGPALFGLAHQGRQGESTLYRLDQATGDAVPIGPTGFRRCSGMDYYFPEGIMYATCAGDGEEEDENVLITVDLLTGEGDLVGPTGIENFDLEESFETISDITIPDPFDKDAPILAYLESGDGYGSLSRFSGNASFIGFTGADCCGNGLAVYWNPTTESIALLHANEQNLNDLDSGTGSIEQSFPLNFSFPADDFPRVNAMDFKPGTFQLYASIQEGGGGNQSEGERQNYLAMIDLTSEDTVGDVRLIGSTVIGLDAIAFAEGFFLAADVDDEDDDGDEFITRFGDQRLFHSEFPVGGESEFSSLAQSAPGAFISTNKGIGKQLAVTPDSDFEQKYGERGYIPFFADDSPAPGTFPDHAPPHLADPYPALRSRGGGDLTQVPGVANPEQANYEAGVDGCVDSFTSDCIEVSQDLVHPHTGERFDNELAALSWNMTMLLAALSQPADPTDIQPWEFDNSDPNADSRGEGMCSFVQPQFCYAMHAPGYGVTELLDETLELYEDRRPRNRWPWETGAQYRIDESSSGFFADWGGGTVHVFGPVAPTWDGEAEFKMLIVPPPSVSDVDHDGVPDLDDNCPNDPNPEQGDADEDGIGDACGGDMDGDGVPDDEDNCSTVANGPLAGTCVEGDSELLGDFCLTDGECGEGGNCSNAQEDSEPEGPLTPGAPGQFSSGGGPDGVGDACDVCVLMANPEQTDSDGDGFGNLCDGDFNQLLPIVGQPDLVQLRQSLGQFRLGSTCPDNAGGAGPFDGPCAEFDVNEDELPIIGLPDLTHFRAFLLGRPPGPKCPSCPLGGGAP